MSLTTLPTLLKFAPNLRIFHIEIQTPTSANADRIFVQSTALMAHCPLCNGASHKVHSQYQRTLLDLPCVGSTLTIILKLRRFFCSSPRCPRKIFCERLGELAPAHARR